MQNIGMVKMCKIAFVSCVQIFVTDVTKILIYRNLLYIKRLEFLRKKI